MGMEMSRDDTLRIDVPVMTYHFKLPTRRFCPNNGTELALLGTYGAGLISINTGVVSALQHTMSAIAGRSGDD